MRPHTVLRNFTPVVQKNKFEKNKNPTQYTWRHQRLLFGFTPTLCADVLLLTSFKPFLSIRTYWAHYMQAAPRSSERSNLYEVYQSVYCQIQSTETGRTQTVHIIAIYIWTPSVEIRCVNRDPFIPFFIIHHLYHTFGKLIGRYDLTFHPHKKIHS